MKTNIVAAKLLAILLVCAGYVLLYYTISIGEALDKTYSFFLFTSIVITILGVIGIFFKLRD